MQNFCHPFFCDWSQAIIDICGCFFYYSSHSSPLSASTSAALGSFAGGVTQNFIPERSEPSVILPFFACCSGLVGLLVVLTLLAAYGSCWPKDQIWGAPVDLCPWGSHIRSLLRCAWLGIEPVPPQRQFQILNCCATARNTSWFNF